MVILKIWKIRLVCSWNPLPVPAQPAYRKLGKRTLWLMLSAQMVPSVIIFIAAVVLFIAQGNGVFPKTPFAAWSSYGVLGAWILFFFVFVITFLITYLSYANICSCWTMTR